MPIDSTKTVKRMTIQKTTSLDDNFVWKALNINNMRINSVGESFDDSNDDFNAVEEDGP